MIETRDFSSMLEDGRITEFRMMRYFKNRGYDVFDLSKDTSYQERDIDFKIVMPDVHTLTVEVKSDRRMQETGNILIEDGMFRTSGFFKGWLHKCAADILCYHDEIADEGYILKWGKLKSELREHCNTMRFWNGFDNCEGRAYLVPVQLAKDVGWVLDIYNLQGV